LVDMRAPEDVLGMRRNHSPLGNHSAFRGHDGRWLQRASGCSVFTVEGFNQVPENDLLSMRGGDEVAHQSIVLVVFMRLMRLVQLL